jgi:hypothetical protein
VPVDLTFKKIPNSRATRGQDAPAARGAAMVARFLGMRRCALATRDAYFSFAYSPLACFRTEMSGSASFHRVRKSCYAVFALAEAIASADFLAASAQMAAAFAAFLVESQSRIVATR